MGLAFVENPAYMPVGIIIGNVVGAGMLQLVPLSWAAIIGIATVAIGLAISMKT